MVRTAALRAQKYASKQDSSVISSRFAAQQSSMIAQVNQTTVTNVSDETTVKAIIEPLGVSTTLFTSYLAFGRQMSKLTRQFPNQTSGSTGSLEAQYIKTRWTSKGLTSSILISIAAAFGWTVT